MPIAGTIDEGERSYIPALGKRWLLPLYDPFLWLLGADKAKQTLIEQAEVKAGFRVLDIGCGTGSMAISIKRMHPEAEVVGIDPDPDALALSKRKAKRAGLSIEFDRGFADHMPYADAAFDCVFSSFMFHHLAADEKTATLGEIRRVLKPGGSLHLLDFVHEHDAHSGEPAHRHLIHRSGVVADRIESRMTSLMVEAGFADAKELKRAKNFFGPIAYFRAISPAA
ncbi:MAG: class I SAM-dependent methyltransferase [Candidatus Binatus sp.]|uniref:class I SAM-dependent methyltransferase n=1 Tax=Candidatus Binatus sp. TaxID=2811406 RepID=UPI003BB16491